MKLLVTGGTGFLGRRAAAHFAALGIQVLVPGRAQLDITEDASVRLWFAANRPDAVLHCAAVSDTGRISFLLPSEQTYSMPFSSMTSNSVPSPDA